MISPSLVRSDRYFPRIFSHHNRRISQTHRPIQHFDHLVEMKKHLRDPFAFVTKYFLFEYFLFLYFLNMYLKYIFQINAEDSNKWKI